MPALRMAAAERCHSVTLNRGMPRHCSVCTHPARQAIDESLSAGLPYRGLAEEHGLSVDALGRHKGGHLAEHGSPGTWVEGTWVPAFPTQRPPFAPGHELSLKHGIYSPRTVDPRAAELVEGVLADPELGYLAQPRFRAAVWSWARAETRVQLLEGWLSDHDSIGVDGDGGVLPVLVALRGWVMTASKMLTRLGLDPASAASLGRDVAAAQVDVVEAMTRVREQAGVIGPASGPPGAQS